MSELRELNEQVAELMDWEWWSFVRQSFLVPPHLARFFGEHPGLGWKHERLEETGVLSETFIDYQYYKLPDFSGDIAAAMEVVEKMRVGGWSFACTLYEGKLPYASFCKLTAASSRNAEADSLPEAICRAALEAVKEKAKTASS